MGLHLWNLAAFAEFSAFAYFFYVCSWFLKKPRIHGLNDESVRRQIWKHHRQETRTDHDVKDQGRPTKFSKDVRRRTLAAMLQSTNTLRAASENFIVVCFIRNLFLLESVRIENGLVGIVYCRKMWPLAPNLCFFYFTLLVIELHLLLIEWI